MTNTLPIEQLMLKRGGSVNPQKFPEETFDLLSIPAYDTGQPQIAVGDDIKSSKQIVQPNDVLLSKIVPHIRRAWVVPQQGINRQIASGEWIIFRGTTFHPQYLRHLVISDWFNARFMRTVSGVGGSLLRARPAEVGKIEITLPPLEEQRRIAGILDQADALRQKRRQAIAKLDQLLQSVFLDMFGNELPDNSYTISDVIDENCGGIRTGPFGSQLLHSEFVDDGIKVLGIDNAVKNRFSEGKARYINEKKYEQLKRYTVSPNDILITIMGTCGRCAVVPQNIGAAINTKHLCCLTLNHETLEPEFLHSYFLLHPAAKRYLHDRAKGAIMNGLNMGVIKAMPIPQIPIQHQRKFVSIKQTIQTRTKNADVQFEVANSLFHSLQQRAFSGGL